jgi:hypothetical protein
MGMVVLREAKPLEFFATEVISPIVKLVDMIIP